ncbi:hypothetical protein ACP4OV_016277 [Aristida adscensionis]
MFLMCNSGHVVCSQCRDKLKASGKCHVCRIPTNGYLRCHAMEHLVESIRIPCPHAADGCTARPPYYDWDTHGQTCPHAHCHCPGKACGFIARDGNYYSGCVHLRDGFNFLLANVTGTTNTTTDGDAATGRQYLFLLNVVRLPLGRSISVVRVHPHAAAAGDVQATSLSNEVECQITYSRFDYTRSKVHKQGGQHTDYRQSFKFRVACTDLSKGLPSPDDSVQFVDLAAGVIKP